MKNVQMALFFVEVKAGHYCIISWVRPVFSLKKDRHICLGQGVWENRNISAKATLAKKMDSPCF